jgi:hypothetical protein
MKTKKSEDLVRYENSHEESEFVDYVDYDFAYDMNINMNSTTNFNNTLNMENFNNTITLGDKLVKFDDTLNKNGQSNFIKPKLSYNNLGEANINNSNYLNETQSEYIGELNNDHKFYGMSHFDEASRVGFGVEEETYEDSIKNYNKNNYEDFENTPKKQKGENLQNPNLLNTINTHLYDTNLTNLNQNFNFNVDSEIEKIDFEKYDADKMESLLDREIFHSSRNVKQNNQEKISAQQLNNFINVKKVNNNERNNPPQSGTKYLQEIKSAVNLVKEPKEMQLKKNTKNVSKSIEDYDKVNLISLNNEDMLNLIKNNREKFISPSKKDNSIIQEEKYNLDKYKVNNNDNHTKNRNKSKSKNYSLESEDFEVELDAQSEQITDFKKTEKKNINKKSANKYPKSSSYDNDINSENYMNIEIPLSQDDNELELLNKLEELQNENSELKLKLKEKDQILNEKNDKITPNKSNTDLTSSITGLPNLELENENRKLREELEEIKLKLEKKSRESIDYKSKFDNLQFEYDVIEKKFSDNKVIVQNLKQEISDKENI